MNTEIKCPRCGEVFKIDEANYESILKQVRDHKFQEDLDARIKKEIELSKAEAKNDYEAKLHLKEEELLKLQQDLALQKSSKDNLIETLKLKNAELEKENKIQIENEVNKAVHDKDIELLKLKNELDRKDSKAKTDADAIRNELDKKYSDLKIEFEKYKNEVQANEKHAKEVKDIQIKQMQETIDFYKDLKAKQSTKAIGESLEQYCSDEFNKIRMTSYPRCYFEKDNNISASGSKGDFIFKDYDENGTEIVSIMFEMKNEADTTATKHKNEDFFKELDKDRNEKGCEYAILVSMLEADSELYNQGIVNVSYRYPKMYVVRPQFFLPIISLIREGALKSVEYKRELEIVKSQDIDLTHFEDNLNNFKDDFGKNFQRASEKHMKAIEEIDKTIANLNKVKENLMASERQLTLANNKVQDVTVKRLTKNAPSVRAKIEGK